MIVLEHDPTSPGDYVTADRHGIPVVTNQYLPMDSVYRVQDQALSGHAGPVLVMHPATAELAAGRNPHDVLDAQHERIRARIDVRFRMATSELYAAGLADRDEIEHAVRWPMAVFPRSRGHVRRPITPSDLPKVNA